MKVRELIANLILMPPDSKVYIDCSCEYPECCTVESCSQWKDIASEEHRDYKWSRPDGEDVFLS